jgi:hypothetical protein
VIEGVTLVLPHHLDLRPGFAAAAPRPGKLRFETLGQPKARTVGNMHARERGKERLIPARVACVQLRKRRLQQVPQKRHRPLVHPLLQCFGRDVHWLFDLRRFGRQLCQRGLRCTPAPKRHQG